MSCDGTQRGDSEPLAYFFDALHVLIGSRQSKIKVLYLDDANSSKDYKIVFGDPKQTVFKDLIRELKQKKLGLNLKPSRCEILFSVMSSESDDQWSHLPFSEFAGGLKLQRKTN